MDLRAAMGDIGLWTFGFSAAPWRSVRDDLAELESLGYRALWIPEAMTKDPFVTAAAMCSTTDELVVATGIANIHLRSPLAMKAAWHSLSETYPSRFVLGIGVSHAPMVDTFTDHTYERPLSTMRTYLDALDGAPYHGPAPDATPRRLLGALGPRMLALAAEQADGAHPYNVTAEHTARAREILGPEAFLAPEQKVIPVVERDEAHRLARQAIAVYLGLPNYTSNLVRLGFDANDFEDGGSDRLIDALFVWGDEARIADGVRAHLDAGADHVAVQVFRGYGGEHAAPIDDWRRLAPALLAP